MKWVRTADIKKQLERVWLRGDICRAAVIDGGLFPLAIRLKQPTSKVMLDEFPIMQDWVKEMRTYAAKNDVELQWVEINHRVLGQQHLPCAVWLENTQQAARLIGKVQLLKQFEHLFKATGKQVALLHSWLLKHPLKALQLAEKWPRLLDICIWMQMHPNPRIYLRQVDIAGVDSKFIEQHKRVLAELFDILLPVYAIDDDYVGVAGFARRYGFLDKPIMLRVRPLDDNLSWLMSSDNQDVSMTAKGFAHLDDMICSRIRHIFIVENEINYLSFPQVPQSILIFGSGYGFEALKQARWLTHHNIYYWGDLDTHGFAILNQLRAKFSQVESFLMDEATLLEHRISWGHEPKQESKDLQYLNKNEADVYDTLRNNILADQLRLEQEHISFACLTDAVHYIVEQHKSQKGDI